MGTSTGTELWKKKKTPGRRKSQNFPIYRRQSDTNEMKLSAEVVQTSELQRKSNSLPEFTNFLRRRPNDETNHNAPNAEFDREFTKKMIEDKEQWHRIKSRLAEANTLTSMGSKQVANEFIQERRESEMAKKKALENAEEGSRLQTFFRRLSNDANERTRALFTWSRRASTTSEETPSEDTPSEE